MLLRSAALQSRPRSSAPRRVSAWGASHVAARACPGRFVAFARTPASGVLRGAGAVVVPSVIPSPGAPSRFAGWLLSRVLPRLLHPLESLAPGPSAASGARPCWQLARSLTDLPWRFLGTSSVPCFTRLRVFALLWRCGLGGGSSRATLFCGALPAPGLGLRSPSFASPRVSDLGVWPSSRLRAFCRVGHVHEGTRVVAALSLFFFRPLACFGPVCGRCYGIASLLRCVPALVALLVG